MFICICMLYGRMGQGGPLITVLVMGHETVKFFQTPSLLRQIFRVMACSQNRFEGQDAALLFSVTKCHLPSQEGSACPLVIFQT